DIARSSYDWDQNNFMKILKENGYETAIIGKVHLEGEPQGFDHYAALIDQGEYYNPNFIIDGDTTQVDGYVTDLITDYTLEWLEQKRDTAKPFAVMYHHKAPHREWLPALRHIADYTKKQYPEPETLFDDYENRGTAAKEAKMSIFDDMNWAGDNKVPPNIMDELGIKETASWDKNAYRNNLGRLNKEQRRVWDSVYNPVMEEFKEQYPKMTKKELFRWRYQRYMQDYLGTIAAI